jgi:FKBP-type peptidyl-prolyl cis-trans isomerase 2
MRIHSHYRDVMALVTGLVLFSSVGACAAENQEAIVVNDEIEEVAAPEAATKGVIVVEDGKQVSIEYTLKLDDGSTADSNVGGEPLQYEQGAGRILPALEAQLAGLKVDDTTHVKLSAEDGYGPVNPEAFQEVDSGQIPEEARTVGSVLVASDGAGQQRPVRVHEVGEDKIVLDLNHPLAGETLIFDVKIVAID